MSKMPSSANQIGNQTFEYPSHLGQRSTGSPSTDLMQYLKNYARSNPESAALWCFGIGFVLGWKLKPW